MPRGPAAVRTMLSTARKTIATVSPAIKAGNVRRKSSDLIVIDPSSGERDRRVEVDPHGPARLFDADAEHGGSYRELRHLQGQRVDATTGSVAVPAAHA